MSMKYTIVLKEIKEVLDQSSFSDKDIFIRKILGAQHILVYGAGRVGLMMKTFAMRLNHLGLNCSYIGEMGVPRTGKGDLLIIGSGSGTTKSSVVLVEIAKSKNLEVICITTAANSIISKLSSSKLVINCPNKDSNSLLTKSVQPMTTLFEQSLLIVLDSLVLDLMAELNEDNLSMSTRHNVIE
jgi:6-phospho-3-hexuloisomerase